MQFQQLWEQQSEPRTVAIIFGRFNPAHRGHAAAWRLASQHDHWYVGTNPSTQGPKDPLPLDEKKQLMLKLMPELAEHLIETTSWLTLADLVYQRHGDVQLLVLTDEVWVAPLLQKYNGQQRSSGEFYQFSSIEQQPTPRLSSATAVRAAAEQNDAEAFELALGLPASTLVAGKPVFDLVRKRLMQQQKPQKKTSKQSVTERRSDAVLAFHSQLNPRLWRNNQLKPQVQRHLLATARTFERALNLPQLQLLDVQLSGSNAAYTYASQSDIDVHLIVADPDHPQLMRRLLDAERSLFNKRHNISVHGHPVELYVQFESDAHHSAGIYSLLHGRWIQRPQQQAAEWNHREVLNKLRDFVHQLAQVIRDQDADAAVALMDRLRRYRRQGLATAGELGTANLVFKLLRREGYISMLADFRTNQLDQQLTLEEQQLI